MRTLLSTCLLAIVVSAPTASAATIAHPTGADDVVIRVSSGGGFVAPQSSLGSLPAFTLYGDGTIVVPGAQIAIDPAPAWLPLSRGQLGERQVQALLRRAKAAGLLAPGAIDYGDMGSIGVSDLPTTTLVLAADGRRVRRDAYALGIPAHGDVPPRAQRRARTALAGFIAALPIRAARTTYVPPGFAVYSEPTPAGGAPSGRVRWPLPRDLATAGARVSSGLAFRCLTVRGRDARTLAAVLRRANVRSRWVDGATSYSLIARPLLPDERGCGSLAR